MHHVRVAGPCGRRSLPSKAPGAARRDVVRPHDGPPGLTRENQGRTPPGATAPSRPRRAAGPRRPPGPSPGGRVLLSKRTSRNPRDRAARAAARQSTIPSTFEPLEDRRLMSAVWTIDGTDAADTIRVHQSGSTVSVTRNGVTTRRSEVSSVVVNGRRGNDTIAADDSLTVPLV